MKLISFVTWIGLTCFFGCASSPAATVAENTLDSNHPLGTPVGSNVPGTFVQTISQRSVSVSLEQIEDVEDRNRVVIGLGIGTLRTNDDLSLSITEKKIETFDDLLSTTFQVVPCERTGEFRLDSEKHHNYSVTVEKVTGNIVLDNAWGLGRDGNSSFVCFSFMSGTLTAANIFQFEP